MKNIHIAILKTDDRWNLSVVADNKVICEAHDLEDLWKVVNYLNLAVDQLKTSEVKEKIKIDVKPIPTPFDPSEDELLPRYGYHWEHKYGHGWSSHSLVRNEDHLVGNKPTKK